MALSEATQDLKMIAEKHGIPVLVTIAMNPATGEVKLGAIGATPSLHAKADQTMRVVKALFEKAGIFDDPNRGPIVVPPRGNFR